MNCDLTDLLQLHIHCFSFRPQQGLPIMNPMLGFVKDIVDTFGFPSPTGVTYYELSEYREPVKLTRLECFRPQQGLPIMNNGTQVQLIRLFKQFPSPTGVTYYEWF